MFDGLEDALESFVCHPAVKTVHLDYSGVAGGTWGCRIHYAKNGELREVGRWESDPLDAYIEARDAFRAALEAAG